MRVFKHSFALLFGTLVLSAAGSAAAVEITSATFGGLRARAIGPAVMSGRIAAIDAVSGTAPVIYVGAASGGVWKSSDGGITFKPLFDDQVQSIGALRVNRQNPDDVWVGSGESWVRNSVGIGDGVYRSTDGGATWKHLGLAGNRHVAAIRLSNRDPETAYVCALGNAWAPSAERGVYRTTDGGANWTQVLHIDDNTGCADLDIDPANPNILFAALWDFKRSPDFFRSGGPGSGLYRSIDGGTHWQRLESGLPEGELGRIAVALAPSRPGTVYATVESATSALYRSDDLGATWTRLSDASTIGMRPFYFSELVIDPQDAERVYKPAFTLGVSTDGGKTFSSLFGGFGSGIHPDHHALWIDPEDPKHLLLGTDGGVYESRDQNGHWRFIANLPVAQFYHVAIDRDWPYHVYGGLQDNGSWRGPSRAPGGIRNRDWDSVGFGDGFWSFPDPDDGNFVYSEFQGGKLLRVNRRLGEVKWISPAAAAGGPELRFNWNTPLHLPPREPGVLLYGSQFVHRSTDRGESWQVISPDLTTNDPRRQRQLQSGGLTIDNSTAENNTTVYTISASPRDAGVIWTGSDDGLVHVTRDGGGQWQNVTRNIKGAPAGAWVSRIEASPHNAAMAFVTIDAHRNGDFAPYVYLTRDYGATWQALAESDVEGYAWVIKQDPVNPALLFLGTEFGLYVSLDSGDHWARFKENLPKVAVHDIVIHPTEHDVILATHGRGVYIIDDITPLRALTADLMDQEIALLPARPAVMVDGGGLQEFEADDGFSAPNPPQAAVITYWLKKRHLFGPFKLNVYDHENRLIVTLPTAKRPGINRIEWPMRLKPPKLPAATSLAPATQGPRVPEGRYRIELVKGTQTLDGEVELVPDPRTPHTAEDRAVQQKLALDLYAALEDLTYLSESVTDLAAQARDRASTLSGTGARRLEKFAAEIDRFNATLVSTSKAGWLSGEEKLREKMSGVYSAVNDYAGRPTATQLAEAEKYQAELAAAVQRADELLADRLPQINALLTTRNLSPLVRQSREQWDKGSEGARSPGGGARRLASLLPLTFSALARW